MPYRQSLYQFNMSQRPAKSIKKRVNKLSPDKNEEFNSTKLVKKDKMKDDKLRERSNEKISAHEQSSPRRKKSKNNSVVSERT